MGKDKQRTRSNVKNKTKEQKDLSSGEISDSESGSVYDPMIGSDFDAFSSKNNVKKTGGRKRGRGENCASDGDKVMNKKVPACFPDLHNRDLQENSELLFNFLNENVISKDKDKYFDFIHMLICDYSSFKSENDFLRTKIAEVTKEFERASAKVVFLHKEKSAIHDQLIKQTQNSVAYSNALKGPAIYRPSNEGQGSDNNINKDKSLLNDSAAVSRENNKTNASGNFEIAKRRKNYNEKNVFILESKNGTGKTAKDVFKTLINPAQLKLKLKSVRVGKNGKAIVVAQDEKQFEKIENALKKSTSDELTIRKTKKPEYLICLKGVELNEREVYKEIINIIAEQNEELLIKREEMRPLFAKKAGKDKYTIVIACDGNGRKNLIGKRIFIGHSSHYVDDYIEPVKCYRCNRFGHTSKTCKTKTEDIRCFKCNSFGHESKDCKNQNSEAEPFCASCHSEAKRKKIQDLSVARHWPETRWCMVRTRLIEMEKIKIAERINQENCNAE